MPMAFYAVGVFHTFHKLLPLTVNAILQKNLIISCRKSNLGMFLTSLKIVLQLENA